MNQTVMFESEQVPVSIPAVVDRWAVRCVDCLGVGFVHEEPPSKWSKEKLTCGCCGGEIESMGRVTRDARLAEDAVVSACDDRCTSARGPLCVCKCGCVNHGTGRVVEIRRDLGAAPRVEGLPANGIAIAEAWRAAFAEVKGAVEAFRSTFPDGYISERNEWIRRNDASRLLMEVNATVKSRTHKSRLAKLVKIEVALAALKRG